MNDSMAVSSSSGAQERRQKFRIPRRRRTRSDSKLGKCKRLMESIRGVATDRGPSAGMRPVSEKHTPTTCSGYNPEAAFSTLEDMHGGEADAESCFKGAALV